MEFLSALRDRTATTRLLILAQLQREPGITLSDVAEGLGITVQAVSAHVRRLAETGLATQRDGAYRPTPDGLQALHEGVGRLREAVTELASGLDTIQVTSAVAAKPIRAGEEVGLAMEQGELAARPARAAASRARARNDAQPGEEVIVDRLQGVVPLQPGRLIIYTVPEPADGGARRVHRGRMADMLMRDKTHKTASLGTSATILVRDLVARRALAQLDFEFASDRAAFNAAERGLDVALWVSRERLPELLATLERLNGRTLHRVAVETRDCPLH